MSQQQSNAENTTHKMFAQRWSPRAFDGQRDVSPEDVATCLEAARWAPSCFGAEPWRFVVCQKSGNAQAWAEMLGCLAPKNQMWANNAPVLMLICADTLFAHNGQANRWATYDAGQAAVSFCLQATALGLVTHQMGGFDSEQISKRFAVPESWLPMAVIALGYQGDVAVLAEEFQSGEINARQRKEHQDIVFFGSF